MTHDETTRHRLRPRVGVALHLIASPDNVEAPAELERLVKLAIADTGLDFVELAPIADDGERAHLASLLRTAGMEVVFNTGPIVWREELDFGSTDGERRKASIRRAIDAIAQAREFGAELVQISPGPDHGDRGPALERTAEAMRELSAEAGEMLLMCELYDRDNFARRLLGPAAEAAAFVELVDCPNFGLLLDTSHIVLQGDDPAAAATLLGDHVVHVHLANCITDAAVEGAGDQHPYFGVPTGVVDAGVAHAFVAALVRSGYFDDPLRGRIGAEVKRFPGEDPAALLFNSCRFVRQAADAVASLRLAVGGVAG